MSPQIPRYSAVWLLTIATVSGSCGGRSETETANAAGEAKAEPEDRSDPIWEDPNLAAGVTSLTQPSYFIDVDETSHPPPETTVGLTQVDGSEGLDGGSGDLTVLLVFDKSSSMLYDWHGRTRWQVANESLRSAIDGVLDELTIGVIRFPLLELCHVPEFGSEHQIDYVSGRRFVSLWQSTEHRLESLGTPLAAAITAADSAITAARREERLTRRFRVILVTDGQPTCNDDVSGAVRTVAGWYAQGIETLVLGLPGSNAAANTLNQLAQAGGREQVIITESAEELDEELYENVR